MLPSSFAGPSGIPMQGIVLEEDGGTEVASNPLPGFRSVLAASEQSHAARSERTSRGGESSAPSESSHNIDTEDDFTSTIPHLEKFYEQLAATGGGQIPPGASASDWVLSVARSYRRLSNWKRRKGRLRALMRPPQEGVAGLSTAAGSGLRAIEGGFSSNTDDSGYEAGYETDADESELSEWESGPKTGRHKRKFDALMHLTHLTMRLSVSERQEEEPDSQNGPMPPPREPPLKTRALGTQPIGLRLSLPHGGSDAPSAEAWRVPEMSAGLLGVASSATYAMHPCDQGPC